MKAALAVLALLPFAARAELVEIQYSGTITRLVNNPRTSAAPGNVLGGWLFIDTARAGPDRNPSRNIGSWGAANFVREGGLPVPDVEADSVSIKNRGAGKIDEFEIVYNRSGGEGVALSVHLLDFLAGDHLEQAFAFRRPAVNEPGESMIGRLFTAPRQFIEFAITHIRVAPPGSCHAP